MQHTWTFCYREELDREDVSITNVDKERWHDRFFVTPKRGIFVFIKFANELEIILIE